MYRFAKRHVMSGTKIDLSESQLLIIHMFVIVLCLNFNEDWHKRAPSVRSLFVTHHCCSLSFRLNLVLGLFLVETCFTLGFSPWFSLGLVTCLALGSVFNVVWG